MSSWKGINVRHVDGRSGQITSDYVGFMHRGLGIEGPEGVEDYVQLNTDGPDSGSVGWEWLCENFSGGPRWLRLGDHFETVPGTAQPE